MYDLNGFERDTLAIVAGLENPIGSEVQSALEEYYEAEIFDARLYPTLKTLEEKGLVTSEMKDGRTKLFTLTRRGVREIAVRREWEDELVPRLEESG